MLAEVNAMTTWETAESLADLAQCQVEEIRKWRDEGPYYGDPLSESAYEFRSCLAQLNDSGVFTYVSSVGGLGESWATYAAFCGLATQEDTSRIKHLIHTDDELQGLQLITYSTWRRRFRAWGRGVPMGEIYGTPALIMGEQLTRSIIKELFPEETNPDAVAVAESATQIVVWDNEVGRNDAIKRLIEIVASRSDIPTEQNQVKEGQA